MFTVQESALAQTLELGEVHFFSVKNPDKPSLTVRVDGSITAQGKPYGTIDSKGRFQSADGNVTAHLDKEGQIITNDRATGLNITPTHTLVHTKKKTKVWIDASGFIQNGKGGEPRIKVQGCEGSKARTCLFVFAVLATSSKR